MSVYICMCEYKHSVYVYTCDTLPSSAANQGDNTVSVAQGGTATPGATKRIYIYAQVHRCLWMYIYIYFSSYNV